MRTILEQCLYLCFLYFPACSLYITKRFQAHHKQRKKGYHIASITLVTGATGLVGYSIFQELLHQKRNVRVLVRSLEKGNRLLPQKCELAKGDITEKMTIKAAMQGCDVVYHAAGFPEQWMLSPKTPMVLPLPLVHIVATAAE